MEVLGAEADRGGGRFTVPTRPVTRTAALPRTPTGSARTVEGQTGAGWAATTAEIPAVAGAAGRVTAAPRSYGVLLGDGSVWYPGSSKRLPAPFALRLVVWLLFAVLLVGLGGLAVEHYHPTWLDFARKTAPSSPVTGSSGPTSSSAAGGQGARGQGTSPQAAGGFHQVSQSSSNTVYDTGTSTYSVVLTFANRVWSVVASPAGSHQYLLAQTLQPSASPKSVTVHGSATVILSATASSIAISAGGKTLGTITDPVVNHSYTFKP